MIALFTSFHMLYCLSQYSKYSLRNGGMTIASSGSPHGLPLATVGNPVEPLLQVGPLYTARGTVFAVTPTR